jgi:2-hydroxy-3-keto-5-methylthiopentenyl-1-phosphate phosphatase
MDDTVLFFDFDNTITQGDVLDEVIEKFSPDGAWRGWEEAWVAGRMSALECLERQIGNLRVTQGSLLAHLDSVRIDGSFAGILRWARAREVDVNIVSDSFLPLVRHILQRHGIDSVPVFANDLAFSGDRLYPSFPFHDAAFPRSANAKARHLEAWRGYTIIFAGDGRSDLDAALASDIVFAKDSLALELEARAVPFTRFDSLAVELAFLEGLPGGARSP